MIRASSGTASVLGMRKTRNQVAPTTAYLMLGERCQRDCAFCAQARGSKARADTLSRVTWPECDEDEAIEGIKRAFVAGEIERCCLQVTVHRDHLKHTMGIATAIGDAVPTCASVIATDVEQVEELLGAGLERVGLSLDAASEEVYRRVKGGDWSRMLNLIEEAANRLPGHISTHLIVGLGETEREMTQMIQQMHDWGVTVGLFAFTSIKGTAMEDRSPPAIGTYRRIQIAHHLIKHRLSSVEGLTFSSEGQIINFGLNRGGLEAALADGRAFQTSGCPGCNRPYYNERPGGTIYNYPRPLTPDEAKRAIGEAFP